MRMLWQESGRVRPWVFKHRQFLIRNHQEWNLSHTPIWRRRNQCRLGPSPWGVYCRARRAELSVPHRTSSGRWCPEPLLFPINSRTAWVPHTHAGSPEHPGKSRQRITNFFFCTKQDKKKTSESKAVSLLNSPRFFFLLAEEQMEERMRKLVGKEQNFPAKIVLSFAQNWKLYALDSAATWAVTPPGETTPVHWPHSSLHPLIHQTFSAANKKKRIIQHTFNQTARQSSQQGDQASFSQEWGKPQATRFAKIKMKSDVNKVIPRWRSWRDREPSWAWSTLCTGTGSLRSLKEPLWFHRKSGSTSGGTEWKR